MDLPRLSSALELYVGRCAYRCSATSPLPALAGKNRPEIVERIKAIEVGRTARGGSKHLTDQEIADTVGVSRTQIKRDLGMDDKKVHMDQNVIHEGIIDAEIVEEDEPVNYETGEILTQKETDPAHAKGAPGNECALVLVSAIRHRHGVHEQILDP